MRRRSSPGGHDRAAAVAAAAASGRDGGATPAGGEEEEEEGEQDAAGRRMRLSPAARERNSPSGAAPDCLLENMHPPPATTPRSGRGVHAAARLQGKVLTLPNCSIFRFCCLSAAAGQGMLAGSRGERRGGEAAPDARARRPARRPLRARRAQRPLPGSTGSAGSSGRLRPGWESRRRRARRSARPVAAAGASLGPPGARRRALPSCASRAARATCAAAAAAAAEGEAPPAARGSLSLHQSVGGRLGRLASEEASAPPPEAAPGAEHAQCRRDSAPLRRAIPLLLVFAAAAGERGGGRGLGDGPASLGAHALALEGWMLGNQAEAERDPGEARAPRAGQVLRGPAPSCTCRMLTVYSGGAQVSLQTKGQGWRGS